MFIFKGINLITIYRLNELGDIKIISLLHILYIKSIRLGNNRI